MNVQGAPKRDPAQGDKLKKHILFTLLGLSLLAACDDPAGNSVNPSPTPTPTPSLSPDGPVPFTTLRGYTGKYEFASGLPIGKEDTIERSLVFCSQAEFDKLISPGSTSNVAPEALDFGRNCVLAIAKVTGAYAYEGQVVAMQMQGGRLNVDYRYSIVYSQDQMLNDYIRPIYTIVSFNKVNYAAMAIAIKPLASPSPSASASPTASPTASASPSASTTPAASPSPTASPSSSVSPSPSASPSS